MNDTHIYFIAGLLRRLASVMVRECFEERTGQELDRDYMMDIRLEMEAIADELIEGIERFNRGETKPVRIRQLLDGVYIGDKK